jgi:hypothetical protein
LSTRNSDSDDDGQFGYRGREDKTEKLKRERERDRAETEKARGKNRSTKVAIDHEVQPSSTAGAVDLLLMRAGQSNLQLVKVAGEQTSNRIEIRNQTLGIGRS